MTFRPTPLAYALAVVLAWAILLGVALDRPEPFVLALPLLVALLRAGGSRPRTLLQAAISAKQDTAYEGDEVALMVSLRLSAPVGIVRMLPVIPPLASSLGGDRTVSPSRLNAPLVWRPRLRCAATGVLDLGHVCFRVWDRGGLWIGEEHHAESLSVTVLPRASEVRHPPAPRHTRGVFGAHPSPATGEGIEFAEIGPFVPGDRLRAINWSTSLRRQRLYASRFRPDRQATVVLLVDTFTVIGARPNSSLDHVLRAAAGLAASYLRRRDQVGILEYGGVARAVRCGGGQNQYPRILWALSRAAPIRTELAQDLRTLPERILPRNALVVALTPLADERFDRAIRALADRGQDLVLLALDTGPLSWPLLRRRDRPPLVRRLWAIEREERLRSLRGHGIRAVAWSPDRPLDAALGAVRIAGMGRQVAWAA